MIKLDSAGVFAIEGRNKGIARIISAKDIVDREGKLVTSKGDHVGMGILVSPRLVLTCAHVVSYACGLDDEQSEPPPGEEVLHVTFPLVEGTSVATAYVRKWRPGSGPSTDIALIELTDDAPAQAGLAILSDIRDVPLDDDRLTVYGFPGLHPFGHHIEARFAGPSIDGVTQIDGTALPSPFIEPGYSGGAVWDRQHDTAIGMVSARLLDKKQQVRIAYMIPAATLQGVARELPVEVQELPPEFKNWWTVGSIFWFLLLLNQFLATQGGSPAPSLAIAGNHPQLAAFAGMHLFAFTAPIVYFWMWRHAKSFRLRDWSWRVPGYSFVRTRSLGRYRKRQSVFTLILILLLPIAGQYHFLNKFHKEGQVYAYTRSFGYDKDLGLTCLGDQQPTEDRLCIIGCVGRYSTVAPKKDAEGGYWNNRYHYGEDHKTEHDSVTFFPFLQPIVVEALSAIALAFAILAQAAIFRCPKKYGFS